MDERCHFHHCNIWSVLWFYFQDQNPQIQSSNNRHAIIFRLRILSPEILKEQLSWTLCTINRLRFLMPRKSASHVWKETLEQESSAPFCKVCPASIMSHANPEWWRTPEERWPSFSTGWVFSIYHLKMIASIELLKGILLWKADEVKLISIPAEILR